MLWESSSISYIVFLLAVFFPQLALSYFHPTELMQQADGGEREKHRLLCVLYRQLGYIENLQAVSLVKYVGINIGFPNILAERHFIFTL